MQPRAPAEDEQVGERVAAEPVAAVHAARHLAGREQAGHGGRGRVGVHPHPAHDVVQVGPTSIGSLVMSTPGQLLELVVHRRQALADVVGRPPRADVEEDAAVRRAAPGLHLGVDRAGHLVARQEVRGPPVVLLVQVPAVGFLLVVRGLALEELGDVVEHEALARGVLERAAVAAHALGHQDAAHRGRPHHPGRVELDELHVDQVGARPVGERLAVAGVLPGVRRELPRLADAAGGQHHRLGLEEHELAGVAPVAEGARHPLAVLEQPLDLALHVHVDRAGGSRGTGACGSSRGRCGRPRGPGARSGGRRSRAAGSGRPWCGRRARP